MLNQIKKNKIKELTTIGTIGHKKKTQYKLHLHIRKKTQYQILKHI